VTWLDALILGLVEGVTEYLPVSSTGHLILTAQLLGLRDSLASRHAVDAFSIVIQGGAILAVLRLYWSRVCAMTRACFATVGLMRFGPNHRYDIVLARNLVIAFLPAAILGPLLEDTLEARLFHPVPILAALAIGGVAMIMVSPSVRERSSLAQGRGHSGDTLGPARALLVGLAQCLAMWPGTSRSMTSILGGLGVGMRAKESAEFSFLLALPTLGGACVWKLRRLVDAPDAVSQLGGWWMIVLGTAAAYFAALLSVKWMVAYLSRGGIAPFGWWRVILAGVLGTALLAGWVSL